MNKDIIVVDANIVIKVVVLEEDSPAAKRLLREWSAQGTLLLAPALFLYEITNILMKKTRQDKMNITEAIETASIILHSGIEISWPVDPDTTLHALELAHAHNLPAAYDAHYLALAEREQCEFWTADERLYNSVKEQLPWVRLMSDPVSISTTG